MLIAQKEQKFFETEDRLQLIVIRANETARKFLEDKKYAYGYVFEVYKEEMTEIVFVTCAPKHFFCWYKTFRNNATIVGCNH